MVCYLSKSITFIDRVIGDVYQGVGVFSEREVAIKLERIEAGNRHLEHEYEVYKALAGIPGVARVRWFGTECDYNVMVTDLLGPSLQDIFSHCTINLKAILLLAEQLVCWQYIATKA